METEKDPNGNLTEIQEEHTETLDYQGQVEIKKQQDRELGAKILSQASFESRHRPIVESSFNKARKRGEKLPGKNNERRNYSYLSRIEGLVEKHGNRLEKRLWDKSAGSLIISPEDISDDYWRTQEQILRDNGQGHTLSDYEKRVLTEDIQKNQRESLKSWSDYLGSEESPYPMWFKVYAWDGMSKMGIFDKEKQQFAKRDKHTVAPYPKLNPAVLAKVYGAISDFYSQSNQDRYTENPECDTELEALVKSGNFNKLYSKILLSEKAIPKTPERTEDIRGEWIEYLPGEEEKLAEAAEGTPWCVADPGTGRSYLETGEYGQYYDEYDEDYDEDENKAKFILFHLRDPETNTLSSSACASIRLNLDGRVAEISGLNDGQALEDSLVPIVEEKVRSLPGGEEFLEAFADKKQLIALDHKMQNNADLTKEELEFLYEFNRPIKSLDTYIDEDPRIYDLRRYYSVFALSRGISVYILQDMIGSFDDFGDFDENYRLSLYDDEDFDEVEEGYCYLLFNLKEDEILRNFKLFYESGKLDPGAILSHIATIRVSKHLDEIIDVIGVDSLVSNANQDILEQNINELLDRGADADQLMRRVRSDAIFYNIDAFVSRGASIDYAKLVKDQHWNPKDFVKNANILINHGFSIDQIVSALSPSSIIHNFDDLVSLGAKIDIDKLPLNDTSLIFSNISKLIEHGIDADQILSTFSKGEIAKNMDVLFEQGVKFGQLAPYLRSSTILRNLDTILKHGTSIDQIISKLSPINIVRHLDDLYSRGAKIDIDRLASSLSQEQLSDYADSLRKYGANV